MASTIKATNIGTPDGTGSITFDRPIITASGVGAGKIVQVVNVIDSAVATGTTQLPENDTIPQNTEGDEFMTLAITPTSASNKLYILFSAGTFRTTPLGTFSAALFQDSTANALAGTMTTFANGWGQRIELTHYMTSGTTSSTTFKIRAGNTNAATTTFNGASGSRYFGGVMSSTLTIMEIAV